MAENLLGILIALIFWGIIFYVAWWGLGKLALPDPFNKIAIAVLVLLTIVVLFYIFFGGLDVAIPRLRH